MDGPATHRLLLTKCLQLLSGPNGLRENLCDLEYPGQPRRGVDPTLINERLTPAIRYACQYWTHHAQQSVAIHDEDRKYDEDRRRFLHRLEDEVHEFLRKHFLHWLEALSLINRIAEAIKYIGVLQSLKWVSNAPAGISERGLTLIYIR